MSVVSPEFSLLSEKNPFKVLLLFQEASQGRSIPSTGPSRDYALEGLDGIKVNGSMIASRMWGKVYDSTNIVIPPGLQIVGWIYRSPPNGLRKAWFSCRGWPWRTFASDEDRELDQAVLSYQLVVDSAAASGRTLKTLVEKVKDSTTHQEASDAWTGLMKRYFEELQAQEVNEGAPSDLYPLSEGPTTCPTCGTKTSTSYQDAGTQTEHVLPAIFADPGSDTGIPQSGGGMWTVEQLDDFMKSFDSNSRAAGQ
jgi:hypothetical protein